MERVEHWEYHSHRAITRRSNAKLLEISSPAAWPWFTTGEDIAGEDLIDADITGEEPEEDVFRLVGSEACVLGSSVVCPGVFTNCVTCVPTSGMKDVDGVLS